MESVHNRFTSVRASVSRGNTETDTALTAGKPETWGAEVATQYISRHHGPPCRPTPQP